METKQHATKNQWVNEEIKKGIRKYFEANKNTNFPKSIGFSKSSSRGKFIVTDASLKEKKNWNKQLNLLYTWIAKGRINKAPNPQNKGNNKAQKDINKIETSPFLKLKKSLKWNDIFWKDKQNN